MTNDLTIVNARIFDGEHAELIEGGIRIVNGKIAEIGDVSTGERVFDAEGSTVIPGLIDAHFHAYAVTFNLYEVDKVPLSYFALAGVGRLNDALARGFTTVRDVAGGDPGFARGIRERRILAPRYLYSGPAIGQTGGHSDVRPPDATNCCLVGPMGRITDGPDEVRKVSRDLLRTGSHCIKVMASGGVSSPTDPIHMVQFTPEEMRAAVEEAERRGSYVAAHAYPPAAVQQSVLAGIRSIEHGNLIDEETARLMAEHGAFLVPTLVAYDAMSRRGASIGMSENALEKNSVVLEAGKRAIELARAAGVPIGFGSDLMGDLADDQLIGLRLQIEVNGVLETLRSATSVNAALLQRDDLGRLAVGAVGDVVVLDGDPFSDPAVIWDDRAHPRTVVQAGSFVS